jgi:hypothetical protein
MTFKKLLLAGIALLAVGGFSPTFAQSVVQQNLSGTECWNAGQGPGGPSTGFLCAYLIRNGTAMSLFSGSGAVVTTMNTQQGTVYWVGTAPTTWAITLPPIPFDGEQVVVATDTTLTTLVTVTPGGSTTLDGTYNSQTLTALTSVLFQFSYGTQKWYRVR